MSPDADMQQFNLNLMTEQETIVMYGGLNSESLQLN